MNQNNLLIFMAICQVTNVFLIFGKDKELFLKNKAGMLFLMLPSIVALSLIWRPL